MGISFGKSSTKESASQKATGQQDPWDVAIPYVTDLLNKTKTASSEIGPTQAQTDAFGQLKTNAAAGNPNAGQIGDLATNLLGDTSVTDAYGDLNRRLTPTADGANLDLGNNEYLNNLLKTVGDDVAWRTNRQFAGAGRDMSGINQQATARGVSQATAPLLLDQYNREQGRTDTAARDLFEGSRSATTTQADINKAGIDVSKEALAAKDYGPNQILNLEEQMKKMPYDELSWLAELLYPAANLGQQTQQEGSSQGKSSTTSMGAKADLGTALSSLMKLSDARAKTDIEIVGALHDGQPVYRYRYIGSPVMQIGLVAQEVEKVVPAAVVEINGLKRVDYAKATEAAANSRRVA